jgi:transposase-like protein
MTPWEEALVVELRRSLALPLDDVVEAMRRCLNPQLSRSGIHRCLKRHGLSARLTPQKAPAVAFHTDAPAGFIHIDVKYLPPLGRRRSYAYVAIDRATRFVYLEILPDRRAQTAAGFLERFLDRFPLAVHTVLTDNGSEFTDRFAVDKKAKPQDRPSGTHRFDRICAERAVTHRLTQPGRRPTAWSNASTAASASISATCRKTGPPTTAAFATMPNAMPTSTPSSPTTIAPACDALTTKHPPSSSPNSRDTTRRSPHRTHSRRMPSAAGTAPLSQPVLVEFRGPRVWLLRVFR